jgi:hypothetical protein
MEALVTYLVAAMVAWIPPRAQELRNPPEPRADALARYESIARDLATVVEDESESALFGGRDARTQTALVMLSIASFESAYTREVDFGIGRGVGDQGNSWCLMQLRIGRGTTREGWTGHDLVEDRTKCFRAALHLLRGSFNSCQSLPLFDRLSAYATGRCERDLYKSQSRVSRAFGWWDRHKLAKS